MNEFNRLTVVAAAEVVAAFQTHNDMEVLEVQWGIAGRCRSSSKSARVADWAHIAYEEDPEVLMEYGKVPLSRAVVSVAMEAPEYHRSSNAWTKLVAGLRRDGFEIRATQVEVASDILGGSTRTQSGVELVRMLPGDVPCLNFREAETEVMLLLVRYHLSVAKGHLTQAISAYSRGEWSSANGELRKFHESYLDEIAASLGYEGDGESKARRDYLGTLQPQFLLSAYNEWHSNNRKPQFVQGLMSRMHPHGGHPGLSEEDDATFRLQISLVTARLLLRRFDQRVTSAPE